MALDGSDGCPSVPPVACGQGHNKATADPERKFTLSCFEVFAQATQDSSRPVFKLYWGRLQWLTFLHLATYTRRRRRPQHQAWPTAELHVCPYLGPSLAALNNLSCVVHLKWDVLSCSVALRSRVSLYKTSWLVTLAPHSTPPESSCLVVRENLTAKTFRWRLVTCLWRGSEHCWPTIHGLLFLSLLCRRVRLATLDLRLIGLLWQFL